MIMIPLIPALKKVAEEARKQYKPTKELEAALKELDRAIEDQKNRHQEALKEQGIKCVECGRLFVPLRREYSPFCSLGCKYKVY